MNRDASIPPSQLRYRPSLQGQWALAASAGLLALGAGAASLGWGMGWPAAARWMLLPALVSTYIFWFLRRHLPENFSPDGVLRETLGWGNALTTGRAMLLALLSGFLLLPRPVGSWAWVPGGLYTLAVLLDFFDGYAARKTHHVTRLGELLDMEFDGWGVLVAALLAVKYGQAPAWYVLVGLARYLYVAGLALRTRLGWVNHPLPANATRRMMAGLQMGLSFVLLWPVFGPPGTHWAAVFFSLPFLLGFAKDWLQTCGWYKPDSGRSGSGLAAWTTRWLPLGLRAAAVILGLSRLPALTGAQGAWMIVVASLLGLGIAPRSTAVMGMLLIGFLPVSSATILLLALYCGVLYLGGGSLTLWGPEERLIQTNIKKGALE